jgi:energy-converting hydrogenase Eha subunit C
MIKVIRICLWALTIICSLFSAYYLYLAAAGSDTAAQESAAAGIGILLVAVPFGLAYSASAIVRINRDDGDF